MVAGRNLRESDEEILFECDEILGQKEWLARVLVM